MNYYLIGLPVMIMFEILLIKHIHEQRREYISQTDLPLFVQYLITIIATAILYPFWPILLVSIIRCGVKLVKKELDRRNDYEDIFLP